MKKIKILLIAACFLICFSIEAYTQTSPELKEKSASSFSQPKFIPDISFILDFATVYRDIKDGEYEGLEVPIFIHEEEHEEGHEEDHDENHGHQHESMNSKRGFNLNYGELVLYSAVDPYFELFATFHFGTDNFEIEEGFVNTTALPYGIQLKIGKFLSNVGRLNGQHAHYWDFSDMPVVYQSFFGGHGLLEKGLQAGFVPPIDIYLLIGAEALQGENEQSFGCEGFSNSHIEVEKSKFTNMYTEFLKSSIDINNLTILFGLSIVHGKTRINHELEDDSGHATYGKTIIGIGDLTLKYLIDSYRYMALQSEYIYRHLDGERYEADSGVTSTIPLEKKQSGFYSQLVLKPFQLWRIGFRYEKFLQNEISMDGEEQDSPGSLYKMSGMLEYNPSEFSRIRLQYNYDRTKYAHEEVKPFHEVILQFNMSIGAHGAHKF